MANLWRYHATVETQVDRRQMADRHQIAIFPYLRYGKVGFFVETAVR